MGKRLIRWLDEGHWTALGDAFYARPGSTGIAWKAKGNAVRFATIRSFKGLEADIVFLIGLKEGKQTCTDADIYVGGSRARFLLYVFHNRADPPKAISVK